MLTFGVLNSSVLDRDAVDVAGADDADLLYIDIAFNHFHHEFVNAFGPSFARTDAAFLIPLCDGRGVKHLGVLDDVRLDQGAAFQRVHDPFIHNFVGFRDDIDHIKWGRI